MKLESIERFMEDGCTVGLFFNLIILLSYFDIGL